MRPVIFNTPHFRPGRDLQNEGFPAPAMPLPTFSGPAVRRLEDPPAPDLLQRPHGLIGDQDNASSVRPITAIWASARYELLAPKAHNAGAAVSSTNLYLDPVDHSDSIIEIR